MDIEGVLLTGGASSRMGSDKAQLMVDGAPLAARIAIQISAVGIRVTVLGNQPIPGFDFFADAVEYAGPLLTLARFAPSQEAVLVASCDLVRFDPRLIDLLASRIGDHDAAIPLIGDRAQPLCALYHRRCWDSLVGLVAEGRRTMMAWVDQLDVQSVDESAFAGAQIEPTSALGANTPEEFARAIGPS